MAATPSRRSAASTVVSRTPHPNPPMPTGNCAASRAIRVQFARVTSACTAYRASSAAKSAAWLRRYVVYSSPYRVRAGGPPRSPRGTGGMGPTAMGTAHSAAEKSRLSSRCHSSALSPWRYTARQVRCTRATSTAGSAARMASHTSGGRAHHSVGSGGSGGSACGVAAPTPPPTPAALAAACCCDSHRRCHHADDPRGAEYDGVDPSGGGSGRDGRSAVGGSGDGGARMGGRVGGSGCIRGTAPAAAISGDGGGGGAAAAAGGGGSANWGSVDASGDGGAAATGGAATAGGGTAAYGAGAGDCDGTAALLAPLVVVLLLLVVPALLGGELLAILRGKGGGRAAIRQQ